MSGEVRGRGHGVGNIGSRHPLRIPTGSAIYCPHSGHGNRRKSGPREWRICRVSSFGPSTNFQHHTMGNDNVDGLHTKPGRHLGQTLPSEEISTGTSPVSEQLWNGFAQLLLQRRYVHPALPAPYAVNRLGTGRVGVDTIHRSSLKAATNNA